MFCVTLHHIQLFGSMRMVLCFDCSESLKLSRFFSAQTAAILVELIHCQTMTFVKQEVGSIFPHGRLIQLSSPDDLPVAVQWMNTNHGGPMQFLRNTLATEAAACFSVVVVGALSDLECIHDFLIMVGNATDPCM